MQNQQVSRTSILYLKVQDSSQQAEKAALYDSGMCCQTLWSCLRQVSCFRSPSVLCLQAIVWDEYLTGPFGLIAQYSLLKVRTLFIQTDHRAHQMHHVVLFQVTVVVCVAGVASHCSHSALCLKVFNGIKLTKPKNRLKTFDCDFFPLENHFQSHSFIECHWCRICGRQAYIAKKQLGFLLA